MKIAIIGTWFTDAVMAPAFQAHGCEIDIIRSEDRDGVIAACRGDADLIAVISEPTYHFDHVMIALDHGKHVACDKPFGRNADEARRMRDRARALGVLHFLCFGYREHRARVQAKAWIDSGAIGTLRHISWMQLNNVMREQGYRWMFDREQIGGWIATYGTHAFDMIRHWYGGAQVADCGGLMRTETRQRPDPDGVLRDCSAEDAFSAWLVMDNGATATLDSAASGAVGFGMQVKLLGSAGAVEIDNDLKVNLIRPGQPTETVTYEPYVGDSHLIGMIPWADRVVNALRTGEQITPNFDDGLAAAEVVDRLRERMVRAGN